MAEPALFEQIRLYLPKYLSPEKGRDLFEALNQFPDNRPLYSSSRNKKDLLQGDGWRGFVVVNFHTLEKKSVRGLVISNSCDLDERNVPHPSAGILFTPIISLADFESLLSKDRGEGRAVAICDSIRRQRNTSVFYLPAEPGVIEEGMVRLDDIHTHPLRHFLDSSPEKLFELTQFGLYLFLVKLSIHFARMQENVIR